MRLREKHSWLADTAQCLIFVHILIQGMLPTPLKANQLEEQNQDNDNGSYPVREQQHFPTLLYAVDVQYCCDCTVTAD